MKNIKSYFLFTILLSISFLYSSDLSAIHSNQQDVSVLDEDVCCAEILHIKDFDSDDIYPKRKKKKKKKKKRKRKVLKKEKKKRRIAGSSRELDEDGNEIIEESRDKRDDARMQRTIKNLLKSWILTGIGTLGSLVLAFVSIAFGGEVIALLGFIIGYVGFYILGLATFVLFIVWLVLFLTENL